LIAPYFNKPTQSGLYAHFSAVARAVDIPMVIYNIPSRTGVDVQPSTIVQLAQEFSHIVGVKESSGILDHTSELIHQLKGGFIILSGDDSLTLSMLALGAKGVISVVANILPKEVADMIHEWELGNIVGARAKHYRMFHLVKTLFIETNPVPVKTAMSIMGMCTSELRLPLVSMNKNNEKHLRAALVDFGLVQ